MYIPTSLLFEAWEEDEMNKKELEYYLKVNQHVLKNAAIDRIK